KSGPKRSNGTGLRRRRKKVWEQPQLWVEENEIPHVADRT
ncbi:hypothetical protein Tco_0553106, partial [Tanacetum coccineum]